MSERYKDAIAKALRMQLSRGQGFIETLRLAVDELQADLDRGLGPRLVKLSLRWASGDEQWYVADMHGDGRKMRLLRASLVDDYSAKVEVDGLPAEVVDCDMLSQKICEALLTEGVVAFLQAAQRSTWRHD